MILFCYYLPPNQVFAIVDPNIEHEIKIINEILSENVCHVIGFDIFSTQVFKETCEKKTKNLGNGLLKSNDIF